MRQQLHALPALLRRLVQRLLEPPLNQDHVLLQLGHLPVQAGQEQAIKGQTSAACYERCMTCSIRVIYEPMGSTGLFE